MSRDGSIRVSSGTGEFYKNLKCEGEKHKNFHSLNGSGHGYSEVEPEFLEISGKEGKSTEFLN